MDSPQVLIHLEDRKLRSCFWDHDDLDVMIVDGLDVEGFRRFSTDWRVADNRVDVLMSRFSENGLETLGSSCLNLQKLIGIPSGSTNHCEYAREQLSRFSKMDRGSLGFGSSLKVHSAAELICFLYYYRGQYMLWTLNNSKCRRCFFLLCKMKIFNYITSRVNIDLIGALVLVPPC